MVISLTSCIEPNRNGTSWEKGEGKGSIRCTLEDLHQDRGWRRHRAVRGGASRVEGPPSGRGLRSGRRAERRARCGARARAADLVSRSARSGATRPVHDRCRAGHARSGEARQGAGGAARWRRSGGRAGAGDRPARGATAAAQAVHPAGRRAEGSRAATGAHHLPPGRARRGDVAPRPQGRRLVFDRAVSQPAVRSAVRAGTRGQPHRRRPRAHVVTIRVAIAEQHDASYDIVIGRGLAADLPALVKATCPAARYAVITDSHVAKLYGEKLVARCRDATLHAELFEFPAGEPNKTRETWASLSDRLLQRQFGRDCGAIALGGGVVGDVAGAFPSIRFSRMPSIQLPTTLLAMIDSSIGGKTGVDVPDGKNLLGAFHQPRLVVADPDVLGSLAPPQLAAGMAEAVKHGVIADRQYFDALEREHGAVIAREAVALERVVRRSVEIKADVVAADEREAGRRAILNFGHTVAHAIETTAKFATLHGEAGAIGMADEAPLAEALG